MGDTEKRIPVERKRLFAGQMYLLLKELQYTQHTTTIALWYKVDDLLMEIENPEIVWDGEFYSYRKRRTNG